MPKNIIHQVEAICRSFIWSGKDCSRKAPIAWDKVCDPRCEGGLNIIALRIGTRQTMLKLLWNIQGKKDKLWVKGLDEYYVKGMDVFQVQIAATYS